MRFLTSSFFHQITPSGPLIHGLKPFFIFDYEIDFLVVSAANDTADHKSDP
jgi:hypothetical protein